ncbi:MAG TPA: hypothetical protein VLA12_13880, partial [Planctomycetaceae bacterium]|nr:hypothetical protein [Planctomycetaceae bacterium]
MNKTKLLFHFGTVVLLLLIAAVGVHSSSLKPLEDLDVDLPDTLENYRGRIIDSVIIDNRNIFDTDLREFRHLIYRTANDLHMTTRAGVVRREVLLKPGERFDPELAEETGRNLRNQLYLYDAWVEVEELPTKHVIVRVITIDQWSLSGGVEFSREGNESRYKFWIEEKNFLGRNLHWRTEEVVQEKEDDYFALTYYDKRLSGRPYSFLFGYSSNDLNSFT